MLLSVQFINGYRVGATILRPIGKGFMLNSHRLASKSKGRPDDTNYCKLSRIFIEDALQENSLVRLKKEDTNYVVNVMRMKSGSSIRVFNPTHGEFLAEVQCGKRDASLKVLSQLRTIDTTVTGARRKAFPAVLFFAPIKKTRLKTLLEKATELGAEHLVPVLTQNTQYPLEAASLEQYQRICIQSAEQCERLTLPTLHPQITLSDLLAGIKNDPNNATKGKTVAFNTAKLLSLPLFVCAERLSRESAPDVRETSDANANNKAAQPLLFAVRQHLYAHNRTLANTANTNTNTNTCSPSFGVFVGPEGGFTAAELDSLASTTQHSNRAQSAQFVSLGENVLRAETASIAALSAVACEVDAMEHEHHWYATTGLPYNLPPIPVGV